MTLSASASGRRGALSQHARHDPLDTTAAARRAAASKLDAKLLRAIDERDPGLPENERQRRLFYARKLHFANLGVLSVKARQAAKAAPL